MEFRSLVDLCVITVIDNLDKIGDVGDTEDELLKRIFEHCNADQLKHIEAASKGRDLSEATDSMWKRFYGRRWGLDAVKAVQVKMTKKGFRFTWRQLWDAKEMELRDREESSVNRMREAYQDAQRAKQERRVQVCNVLPPGAKKVKGTKGSFGGRAGAAGLQKGRLMAKAKKEYAASRERSFLESVKKKHTYIPPRSTPKPLPAAVGNPSRLKPPAPLTPLRTTPTAKSHPPFQQAPRPVPMGSQGPMPHGSVGGRVDVGALHQGLPRRQPLVSACTLSFGKASGGECSLAFGGAKRKAYESSGGNLPVKRSLLAANGPPWDLATQRQGAQSFSGRR